MSTLTHDETALVECTYDEAYYKRLDPVARCGYEDYFGRESATRMAAARVFVTLLGALGQRPGMLLDVGCGGGYFVKAATSAGWIAEGIDSSVFAVSMARKIVGVNVFCGTLAEYARRKRRDRMFDAITMLDVIEHLRDPLEELRLVRRILAPEGLLVIVTPLYGGRLAASQGTDYVQFKRDHIYHFTRETLARLLTAGGFERKRMAALDEVLIEMGSSVPREVLEKYRRQREHLLAVCGGGGLRCDERIRDVAVAGGSLRAWSRCGRAYAERR